MARSRPIRHAARQGPLRRQRYDAAVAVARRPEQYRELHRLLRLWRLRAVAYSDPGFEGRLAAVRDTVAAGGQEGTPIEEVVPDWDERVAVARRRAGG